VAATRSNWKPNERLRPRRRGTRLRAPVVVHRLPTPPASEGFHRCARHQTVRLARSPSGSFLALAVTGASILMAASGVLLGAEPGNRTVSHAVVTQLVFTIGWLVLSLVCGMIAGTHPQPSAPCGQRRGASARRKLRDRPPRRPVFRCGLLHDRRHPARNERLDCSSSTTSNKSSKSTRSTSMSPTCETCSSTCSCTRSPSGAPRSSGGMHGSTMPRSRRGRSACAAALNRNPYTQMMRTRLHRSLVPGLDEGDVRDRAREFFPVGFLELGLNELALLLSIENVAELVHPLFDQSG